MKIEVINLDGKKAGEVSVNDDIFALEVRSDLIARVYNWQFANSHYGSKKTKSIKDVVGTTKKPWKQKGTGRARQGSLRSAQMRGGGLAHAYHKVYNPIKLNKKVKVLGLKHALSDKASSKNIVVFDSFDVQKVSTKQISEKLAKLALGKILFVGDKEKDKNFYLSIRNIKNVRFLEQKAINVMSILRCRNVVFSKDAIEAVNDKIANFKRIADKTESKKEVKPAKTQRKEKKEVAKSAVKVVKKKTVKTKKQKVA